MPSEIAIIRTRQGLEFIGEFTHNPETCSFSLRNPLQVALLTIQIPDQAGKRIAFQYEFQLQPILSGMSHYMDISVDDAHILLVGPDFPHPRQKALVQKYREMVSHQDHEKAGLHKPRGLEPVQ